MTLHSRVGADNIRALPLDMHTGSQQERVLSHTNACENIAKRSEKLSYKVHTWPYYIPHIIPQFSSPPCRIGWARHPRSIIPMKSNLFQRLCVAPLPRPKDCNTYVCTPTSASLSQNGSASLLFALLATPGWSSQAVCAVLSMLQLAVGCRRHIGYRRDIS